MTNPRPEPFIVSLTKHLPTAEMILLPALVIGIILAAMNMDSLVLKVSLLGLGVVYFLFAYRRIDIPEQEGGRSGFAELFGLLILPRILWIASGISALGAAIHLIDFGNDGYKRLLFSGGLMIGIGSVILLVLLAGGMKQIRFVMPILLRAVPLCCVDFYILFK